MSDAPANWYPDPHGRHELRYWDGATWTEHVSDRGVTAIDRPTASRLDRIDSALTVGNEADPDKIRRQLTDVGHRGAGLTAPVSGGDGTLFNEPVLVVNQKVKVLELNNQYSVFNQHGQRIAAVNQVGQTTAKKVMRLVSSLDQFMTHRLEITDTSGAVVLRLTRPAKFIKSRILVSDGNDREIGAIVQESMIGKIQFGLQAGGERLGTIKAENWRAWNFRIEDASGAEVARITKTWEGLAKTMFTTADNYVVQIHHKPEPTLHALVVASALSVDTALKQDARGFG